MSHKKRPHIISFDKIITENDLKNGNIILLSGRPATGKTETCCKLLDKFKEKYNCLLFNLQGSDLSFWLDNTNQSFILNEFQSSIEIIKTTERTRKNGSLKFVFIDELQLLTDTREWFIMKILNLCYSDKIVFVITNTLKRDGIKKHNCLPEYKYLNNLECFNHCCKHIVIGIKDEIEKETDYYEYL